MKLAHSIGNKIIALAGAVILASMVGMVLFYAKQQEKSILEQNAANMNNLTESVSQGLQTVMLAGYADIAQSYAGSLKKVPQILDFRIMRVNGLEAFQDNQTIESVNKRLGEEEFLPREEEKEARVLEEGHPEFKPVLESKAQRSYVEEVNGVTTLTYLVPILNQKPCFRCHGGNHPIRGVLKLTTSLEPVQAAIADTQDRATRVLVMAVLGSLFLIGLLVRFTVVRPITRVTAAMTEVARGDYGQTVPVLGRDELSRMAESFNTMLGEVVRSQHSLIQEKNKLTTIILSAKEAIIVTNALGEIVLVNPAAERFLEKDAAEIIQDGFLNIIDDPAYVAAFIEREGHDMPDTLVYKNRIINFFAAAIKNVEGEAIGSAALIRDVTEEKKLEEQLRTMSYTDKLTGLFNRRRMEELLAKEYERARRYSLEVSVLFFDVDHFKKFNDTYGHDMGDKVLEIIGREAKDHFRSVDFPCRYGGEEFCIILPNTGDKGAWIAAERFRQRIELCPVAEGVRVTISIGVATYPYCAAVSPENFLKQADTALYEGKRAGRNRVITWEEIKDKATAGGH